MSATHPNTTFMLGATGFLGHFVLRDLLMRGHHVVAMVRAPRDKARAELVDMVGKIGLDLEPCFQRGQLTLVEGVLPDDLPDCTWGHTQSILHCDACLDLASNGEGEPFRTNVAGTEALAEWALVNGVGRFFSVSTAYTCGWRGGLVKEEFHRTEPEFQTDYDRSKWQAEWILEEWSNWLGNSLTIFRPSFLVGDSATGYTTQYGGFYQLARLVEMLKRHHRDPNNGELTHVPLRIPARPGQAQNFVPVDFVARVMVEVMSNPHARGRIFHLTHPEAPTHDMLKRCYEEYFGLEGGYFADPDEVVGQCSSAEAMLWDQYDVLTQRVVKDSPIFDMTNTRAVMEVAGMEFPALDRDRIFKLFDFAAARGWGKKAERVHR